jgi:hypothetical protein
VCPAGIVLDEDTPVRSIMKKYKTTFGALQVMNVDLLKDAKPSSILTEV